MNVQACDRCKTMIDQKDLIRRPDIGGFLFASIDYIITSATETGRRVVGSESSHADLCGTCAKELFEFVHKGDFVYSPAPSGENTEEKT